MRHPRLLLRAGLVYLAAVSVAAGVWAWLAPRGLYDTFPGLARSWTGEARPYDMQAVQTTGGGNLLAAALYFFAFAWPNANTVRASAIAGLAFQMPHFVAQLSYLNVVPTVEQQAFQTMALGLNVLLPMLLFVAAGRWATPAESAETADSLDLPGVRGMRSAASGMGGVKGTLKQPLVTGRPLAGRWLPTGRPPQQPRRPRALRRP